MRVSAVTVTALLIPGTTTGCRCGSEAHRLPVVIAASTGSGRSPELRARVSPPAATSTTSDTDTCSAGLVMSPTPGPACPGRCGPSTAACHRFAGHRCGEPPAVCLTTSSDVGRHDANQGRRPSHLAAGVVTPAGEKVRYRKRRKVTLRIRVPRRPHVWLVPAANCSATPEVRSGHRSRPAGIARRVDHEHAVAVRRVCPQVLVLHRRGESRHGHDSPPHPDRRRLGTPVCAAPPLPEGPAPDRSATAGSTRSGPVPRPPPVLAGLGG